MFQLFVYECSAPECSAVTTITLTPPEIHDQVIESLTNKDLLKERTDQAFRANEANTQGMRYPLPIEVLNDLRIYIKNAWAQDPGKKSIKLSNRRFMVRFGPRGEACRTVLEEFKFRLDEENDCWHVPEPVAEQAPLEHPDNVFLDNIEKELLALVVLRPEEEHHSVQDLPRPVSALREFQRALGCQDSDKHPSSRTTENDPYLRPAPFVALGIPQAAADDLVCRFYQYQVSTDPGNTPTYLQFLKHIANFRQSELLQTEVVLEESKGNYDLDTLYEAHRYFGLDAADATIDDDYVIGIFSSRLQDSPTHEQRMRMYLRIIGQHRNSRKIKEFADNSKFAVQVVC
jgi:ubiquitin carboxyl-terminal hydrolase 25